VRNVYAIVLAVAALLGLSAPARADEAPVTLIVEFDVKPDRLADFLPIAETIGTSMVAEAGFVSAAAYRDLADPNRFTFVEIWSSQALHRAHYDRIVASGDWARIGAMTAGPPALRYARRISEVR
jgi:quinol monooxygenase YgiN